MHTSPQQELTLEGVKFALLIFVPSVIKIRMSYTPGVVKGTKKSSMCPPAKCRLQRFSNTVQCNAVAITKTGLVVGYVLLIS